MIASFAVAANRSANTLVPLMLAATEAYAAKKPASATADTGKVAGGKPATGRLCQAGLGKIRRVSGTSPRALTRYRQKGSRRPRANSYAAKKSPGRTKPTLPCGQPRRASPSAIALADPLGSPLPERPTWLLLDA